MGNVRFYPVFENCQQKSEQFFRLNEWEPPLRKLSKRVFTRFSAQQKRGQPQVTSLMIQIFEFYSVTWKFSFENLSTPWQSKDLVKTFVVFRHSKQPNLFRILTQNSDFLELFWISFGILDTWGLEATKIFWAFLVRCTGEPN